VDKIGVLDFGESLIEALLEAELVTDIPSLYTVDVEAAAALVAGGRKVGGTAHRAFKNLHSQTLLSFPLFMGSLGIDGWGRSMFEKLEAAGFDNPEVCPMTSIRYVKGIGASKEAALISGWCQRMPMIRRLLEHISIKETGQGQLTGQTFCFTGFRDKELEAAIRAAGGTIKSSVGKSLTYLVAANPASTSGKPAKARKLGIEVIGREAAKEMA
jgi:NAD-dependent DNA ligase